MRAERDGRRGTMGRCRSSHARDPARRRSERRDRSQWAPFQPSKHCKLEQERVAAMGSRKENRSREGGWRRVRLPDFGAREPQRASELPRMAERRARLTQCPCGRPTSLSAEPALGAVLATSIAQVTADSHPLTAWSFEAGVRLSGRSQEAVGCEQEKTAGRSLLRL